MVQAEPYIAGQAQILTHELRLDLDTPLSVFLKLAADDPYSFLFESVEGGAVLGRYSAIGYDPDLLWRVKGGVAATAHDLENWTDATIPALDDLKRMVDLCAINDDAGALPPMASSGLFGMFGYDMIRHVEEIPDNNPDPLNLPDALLMRPRMIAVVDNIKQTLTLATPIYPDGQGFEQAANAAQQRIDCALAKLAKGVEAPAPHQGEKDFNAIAQTPKSDFLQAIAKAKNHILDGDIFQVVLSQRFEGDFAADALALYRSLRHLNPSPFLVLMNLGDFSLIASSPEIMVRLRDGVMSVRPIAGTRHRTHDEAQDHALEAELLADPKERAEHLMLLDLGRNDVGRVAQIGSVQVTQQFMVERYSHVMHIVSNVEGQIRPELHPVDVLFSAFPAGTVSGAPKIRAMQIIDDLEPLRRGFYAGCIGYIDGLGNVDHCIALRTALLKDGQLTIQSGAGIVADSDPEAEYQETINKAKALFRAAQDAVLADS